MTDGPDPERLKALGERIEAARTRDDRPGTGAAKYTATSLGWRMVTELVAGMMIGLGFGWLMDTLLGTLPIFLVIFGLLGFVAGIRVMMRTAGSMNKGRSGGSGGSSGEFTDTGGGDGGGD